MIEKPVGSVIPVKVGGKEYETVIDADGVQRFRLNGVVEWLHGMDKLNLNEIARAYQATRTPPFSQRDYAEFNMMLGYSVCGFAELSSFEDMEIENPLDEEEGEVEVTT